jgi:pilus assembly protein CpaF
MFWNEDNKHVIANVANAAEISYPQATTIDDALALKVRLHQRLIDLLNLNLLDRIPRDTLRLLLGLGPLEPLLQDDDQRHPDQHPQGGLCRAARPSWS